MKNLSINIYQGKQKLIYSDINIVIDVLRAFTVSHYAFLNNVKKIVLVNSVSKALELKKEDTVLSGEIKGLKIESFDCGNSPYEISKLNLKDKTLIQKTTNGVEVALHSLNTDNLFVTGYTNAYTLSTYIKNYIKKIDKQNITINIIASHPTADEDLACAYYIKSIIENDSINLQKLDEDMVFSILNAKASKKFLDISNKDFNVLDLTMSSVTINSNFVMNVFTSDNNIEIRKKNV